MDTSIWSFVGQFAIAVVTALGTAWAFAARLDQRVKHLEEIVKSLQQEEGKSRERLAACETSLKEREPLTRRKSPVSLTERGMDFLKDSGSEKFVDNNFAELLKKVEEHVPQTAYDVQEDARKVIESLCDDERLNSIKEFLFKDGSSLDDVVTVMGIYLRDKILKNKNWNVADVDIHEAQHRS